MAASRTSSAAARPSSLQERPLAQERLCDQLLEGVDARGPGQGGVGQHPQRRRHLVDGRAKAHQARIQIADGREEGVAPTLADPAAVAERKALARAEAVSLAPRF